MSEPRKKLLSIAIPVFDEEENLDATHARVKAVMEGLADRYDHEILFGDNRSTDGSFEVLRRLAREDPKVRVLRYSRNFGYQASVYTLTVMASGDAVIQLDCDLQDPPELIPGMVELWEAGNEVVYGIRRSRQEGAVLTGARRVFYRVLRALAHDDLPLDAGDFRLIDRRVADVLRRIHDSSPYVRGAVASLGFRQVGFEYDRDARVAGETKFGMFDLVAVAADGLFNHSLVPLRLGTWVGAAAFLAALGLTAVYVLGRLLATEPWPAGFATITALILISIALNSLLLGILGEYVGRIYRQVKGRPVTIVDELVNFDADRPDGGAGVL